MKALIINGARKGEITLKVPHDLILQTLKEQGYKIVYLLIRDLNIESFPLYVDSLPSSVIKIFELIAAYRENNDTSKLQVLVE